MPFSLFRLSLLSIVIVGVTMTYTHASLVGYAGGGVPRGFYSISELDGSATFIVGSPIELTSGGLAFLGGDLYASNLVLPNRYGIVDLNTGSVTPVGLQIMPDSPNWQGLASDEDSGVLYTVPLEDNILTRISPGGSITKVGTGIGISTGIRGMAFDDDNDILYAVDRQATDATLYSINTLTGLASAIGQLGLNQSIEDVALAYDEDNNILYGVSAVTRSLYTLNVTNGNATLVGTHNNVPFGSIAWFSDRQIETSVPEPLTATLGLMGITVLGIVMRRRQTA